MQVSREHSFGFPIPRPKPTSVTVEVMNPYDSFDERGPSRKETRKADDRNSQSRQQTEDNGASSRKESIEKSILKKKDSRKNSRKKSSSQAKKSEVDNKIHKILEKSQSIKQKSRISFAEEPTYQTYDARDSAGEWNSPRESHNPRSPRQSQGKESRNNSRANSSANLKQSVTSLKQGQQNLRQSHKSFKDDNDDEPTAKKTSQKSQEKAKKGYAPPKPVMNYSTVEVPPRSRSIKKKNFKEKKQKKHWEHLYELSKIRIESKQVIKEEIERRKNKFEYQYTFKPAVLEDSTQLAVRQGRTVLERQNNFLSRKEEKLKRMAEENEMAELNECRFQPKTVELKQDILQSKDKSFQVSSGITKYLERQMTAQLEKERRQQFYQTKSKQLATKNVRQAPEKGYIQKFQKNLDTSFDECFKDLKKGNLGAGISRIHQLLYQFEVQY